MSIQFALSDRLLVTMESRYVNLLITSNTFSPIVIVGGESVFWPITLVVSMLIVRPKSWQAWTKWLKFWRSLSVWAITAASLTNSSSQISILAKHQVSHAYWANEYGTTANWLLRWRSKYIMLASSTLFCTAVNPGPHTLLKKSASSVSTYAAFTTF